MLDRPFSWSQLSSFQYDKEQWYKKYILGEEMVPNAPMLFGNEVGNKLASDPTFLPEVPRLPIYEKKLIATIKGIKLIGYLDTFQKEPLAFNEYKTSSNPKRWTQKTANEHGQMDFYYLLLWLNYGVPPESIPANLVYIPCRENAEFRVELTGESPQVFPVNKTTADLLKFGNLIVKTREEMLEFIHTHELAVN